MVQLYRIGKASTIRHAHDPSKFWRYMEWIQRRGYKPLSDEESLLLAIIISMGHVLTLDDIFYGLNVCYDIFSRAVNSREPVETSVTQKWTLLQQLKINWGSVLTRLIRKKCLVPEIGPQTVHRWRFVKIPDKMNRFSTLKLDVACNIIFSAIPRFGPGITLHEINYLFPSLEINPVDALYELEIRGWIVSVIDSVLIFN